MAGKGKAVSDEYKSALVDLTFNSKPMINLLTMLAEENSEYAQTIVSVICERIKTVATEQKMPSLYLLDSILKNIGREYVVIISKHIVEVFCCVFEAATDERKRMQLFKLRNTWNQYIPNKTLYDLDVRVTRTDPNWPVAAPVVTSSPNVIHVNPKFLQKNDPNASPISATLAASIVAEKEASKLQSKITKQRLLEEEKRVQEQLRILQADKLKRDREHHELMLQQQQQERERLIAEQKRQLEVLRKQQQNMSDSSTKTATSTGVVVTKVIAGKSKGNEAKVEKSVPVQESIVPATVKSDPSPITTTDDKTNDSKSEEIQDTVVVPPVIPHALVKDPRLKTDVAVNDPRLNRKKGVANKTAVNVLNKIVTNLSKGKPDATPHVTPVRKIRPYINPIYARSPVSIATARKSFASSSFNTLNLSVPLSKNTVVNDTECISPICSGPNIILPDSIANSTPIRNSNLIMVQCHNNVISSSSVVADVTRVTRPLSVTKSQFQETRVVASVITSLPTSAPSTSTTTSNSHVSVLPAHSIVKSTAMSSAFIASKPVSKSSRPEIKIKPIVSFSDVKSPVVPCSSKDGVVASVKQVTSSHSNHKEISEISIKTTVAPQTPASQTGQEATSVSSPSATAQLAETSTLPSGEVPPPFSGEFKSLSTRDMRIASQAAAIATAMHQMQTVPGSSGVMAPEQSAQLAAQLIEIMQGSAAGAVATSTTSTTSGTTTTTMSTTPATSTTPTPAPNVEVEGSRSTSPEENSNNKKKQPKENTKVTEINQSIARGRSARSHSSSGQTDSKNDSSTKTSTRSREKVRERSPHDCESKRETRHSKQRTEGKDDEKLKSPERNLRSRTRDRDKPPAVLGDEPPSKRLKDEQQERGRKARARSPSRYYNRMERKIVSEKRVEKKEKELVLERFRKVSEGDAHESSKTDNEKTSEKERTSPVTVKEKKSEEEEELEIHQKEFNMLKEQLYDIHKKKEKTGAIDQDMLTKIMVEIDQKAKDGVLAKDSKDDLMWQIRHIRAEAKHVTQKHGPAGPKGKKGYTEHQEQGAPNNAHLHWRSRKDHSNDSSQGVPPEQFGPHHRGPRGPEFQNPMFEENHHICDSMADEQGHGDGPQPLHYQDGPPNRPPNIHDAQLPPHMRNNSHGSFMGSHPPYNANEHPQNMGGNIDGPHIPHMMDGPGPPHMMEGQRPLHMDGPRPPHMMDGPRPPHMMEGPRPHHMMEGPRPPHMMEGPRPLHMMEGPRPPHMEGPRPPHMDGSRPPHMMDGPPPPHMMDGPRPPHMMDGPRPPHMMDGPRPPHMMDGPRPPHMMDGPRPPHMMDGPRPPHMMDGPRPPHMMDGPQPHHMMDGPRPHHMMDGPRPPHMMDGPRPTHIDRPQAPHLNVPQPPHMPQPPCVPCPPHMDVSRQALMDVPMPHHMDASCPPLMELPLLPHMDGPQPPHPSHMMRPHHMGDGHQPPSMRDMSNPVYRMDGPPGHMTSAPPGHMTSAPQPPFIMEGIQAGHPMAQPDHTYPLHSQHHMQPTNQGHMLNQGHPPFHIAHGQTTFHPSIDAVSSSAQQPFDVSSLLGQLSAAGLLPKLEKLEPETQKREVPEVKLILDDLKVRHDGAIANIMVGKQCSSCGERFPSEVHSEHLDWHFRQNRKDKGGVRKDCRKWYFDLKDWVEQDTKKAFEELKAKAHTSVPESDEQNVKIEKAEEAAPSKTEEPQNLVSDDSIPVRHAGEVCHVCMDPLDQYWDEDREEWRYRKAVREQNRTYHFHCFADYEPFEEEEEHTPPETPLSPRTLPILSPIPPDNTHTVKEEQLDTTSKLEVSGETSASDMTTELNVSTELNTTSMEFDSSTFSEVGTSPFKGSRLTISMMEAITSASTDGNISLKVDTPSPTPTHTPTDKVSTTNNLNTENDVMNTIQDILRVATSNIKTKTNKDVTVDTKTVDLETSSKNTITGNEKELKLQQEISAILCEIVDTVAKKLLVRESKTVLMLPFVSSITGASCDIIKRRKEATSIETGSVAIWKVNETSVLTGSTIGSKKIETINDKEINTTTDCDNKKDPDEEQEIAFSPYIENMDSPVYPVITTSNLTCVEQEQDTNLQMGKIDVVDFPNSVPLPLQPVIDSNGGVDSILADVAVTMEHLISKVTLNIQSVSPSIDVSASCGNNNENLKLFNKSISVLKLEPCVNEVGSDFNKSVHEVINNNNSVDE